MIDYEVHVLVENKLVWYCNCPAVFFEVFEINRVLITQYSVQYQLQYRYRYRYLYWYHMVTEATQRVQYTFWRDMV